MHCRRKANEKSSVTPAGTSNELDVQNKWEENNNSIIFGPISSYGKTKIGDDKKKQQITPHCSGRKKSESSKLYCREKAQKHFNCVTKHVLEFIYINRYGEVANTARGLLNKENAFPCPRSRLRIWSR